MNVTNIVSKDIYLGSNNYCEVTLYRYDGNEYRPDIYLTVRHYYNTYDDVKEQKESDATLIWNARREDDYEQILKFVELVKNLDVYKP